MNKDEAQRCINIAKKCIVEGNHEKAEKFLKKSLALHETGVAKELLESLSRTAPTASTPSSSSTPTDTTATSETRKRPNTGGGGGGSDANKGKEASPDMIAAVNKVKGKKDYYTILGCNKTATESELKKAYRKLALALHPDKNCAPGANEAFKAVGNAYAVLSNSEKRARYDKYGLEEDAPPSHRAHRHRYTYHDDGDISPEELFNMFFGGMQPTYRRGHVHRQFYNNYTREQTTGDNDASIIGSLLQMSPLFLLILMSVLNSIFTEDPAYSYHRNGQYKIERSTSWNSIRYYVRGDFTEKHTNQKILHLEFEIEKEYKQDLQIKCINNQRRKEQLMYQYRVTGNTRYRDYAESMDLGSCTDYTNFKLPQYINGRP